LQLEAVVPRMEEVQGDGAPAEVRVVHRRLAARAHEARLRLERALELAAGDGELLAIGEVEQLANVPHERDLFVDQAHFRSPPVRCIRARSRLLDLAMLPCELPK